MPLEIAKFPRGLAGLLGLVSGKTPQVLGDVVSGVIDMAQLYSINEISVASGAVVGAVVGVNALTVPIIIPAGEVWFIHNIQQGGTTGVATAYRGTVGVRPNGSAGAIEVDQPPVTYAASEGMATPGGFTGRFFPSGTGFIILCSNVTGAVNPNLTIVYTALKG